MGAQGLESADPFPTPSLPLVSDTCYGENKREGSSVGLGELGAAILNRMIGAGMTEKVTFDKNLQWKGVGHSSVWGRAFWRKAVTGVNVLRWQYVLEMARRHGWLEWSEQHNEERGREAERTGALQASARTLAFSVNDSKGF